MTAKASATVQPRRRAAALQERQRIKMARSVHAFVRGSTMHFYQWLNGPHITAIPNGPSIWICGDCHVGNLGPVADARGRVEIQIRDLDQTIIGNPAYDLIRLALSLATAIRSSDLPGVTTARMLESMIHGYQQAFRRNYRRNGASLPKAVRIVMRRALARTWKHLAQERIEGVAPNIPLGKCFWPLTANERVAVHKLFQKAEIQRLVTCLRSRDDNASVKVVDAAYWQKGCSSLGGLRIAVLLRVGDGEHDEDGLCLIDIKEAVRAVARKDRDAALIRNNAKRVVEGARQLSPFLGERMLACRLLGCSVFLRELRPQDLKVEIEHVTQDEAIRAAAFLAHVVGRAHARQMDASSRRAWFDQLQRGRRNSLKAPSWLWSSVVELLIRHEAAYLEHCRKYALNTTR